MSVIAEEEYYSWIPNDVCIKDPETNDYLGNVIGSRSKEDQLQIVVDNGTAQKEMIRTESNELISEINERAKKFIDIMAIHKDAMREILLYFGGTFVLNASVLDGTPLG